MKTMAEVSLALTPEQLAAVTAGGGVVHAKDPSTDRRYILFEHGVETAVSEDYIREKVAEGIASLDRDEGVEWSLEDLKARLAERLKQRQG